MLAATNGRQLCVQVVFSHLVSSACSWTLGSCWHIVPMTKHSTCFARQLRWVCWGQATSGSSPVWLWATPTALHLTASPSVLLEWSRISGGRAYARGWERVLLLWRKVPRASRSNTVLFLRDTETAANQLNTQTTTRCSGETFFTTEIIGDYSQPSQIWIYILQMMKSIRRPLLYPNESPPVYHVRPTRGAIGLIRRW